MPSKATRFRLEYSPEAADHFEELTARQRAIVLDSVDRQLVHQPAVETRNRKEMRDNPIATWELRLGDLRVYYDVSLDPEPLVKIRAIGVKTGNVLRIGGKVIDL